MSDNDEEEVLIQPFIPHITFPPIKFDVPTIPPRPTPTGVKCAECAGGIGGGIAPPYRATDERSLLLMTSYHIGAIVNPERLGESGLETSYGLLIEVFPPPTNLLLKTEVETIMVIELFGMKHDGYSQGDKQAMAGYKGDGYYVSILPA